MKVILIVILISFLGCNASLVLIKGGVKGDVRLQQKMDSLQLEKNGFNAPERWKKP